ncbi:hypothetical protein GIB67_006261 [Kingdonia uniflora]|uniref:Uncharacterized protein n=1 Tax=Kingdonia uniflora TaxID=39325 RepID=A0A7J7P586_9MAGN|nr:hypothetical protein GIB67_006261 [Kingdonia uniflora]
MYTKQESVFEVKVARNKSSQNSNMKSKYPQCFPKVGAWRSIIMPSNLVKASNSCGVSLGGQLVRPCLQFAVGYNRRGMEETEFKIQKSNSKESNLLALLDRNKCFGVVAGAVKEAIPDSIVNLKSPQISILLELLPLSRVLNGSLVVAVSVLPQSLVNTKPRLCMKPLVPDAKTTKCGT